MSAMKLLDQIITDMSMNETEYDALTMDVSEVINGLKHHSEVSDKACQAIMAFEHLTGKMLVNWGEANAEINYAEYPDHEGS